MKSAEMPAARGWGSWEAPCTPGGQSGLGQHPCGLSAGRPAGAEPWWPWPSWQLDGVQDLGRVCRWDLGVGSQRAVWGLSCGLVRSAQQGGILSFT